MRFVLYNIRYGTGMKMHNFMRSSTRNLERISACLHALEPDLVGLVEVDHGSYRSGGKDQAKLLADALHRAGYDSDMAFGGRQGQALIDADPDRYDAIVCDLRMPDLDGPGLFSWISARHRHLVDRTLFVTGDALGPVAGQFLAECRRPVLEKPFTPAEVARVLGEFDASNGVS